GLERPKGLHQQRVRQRLAGHRGRQTGQIVAGAESVSVPPDEQRADGRSGGLRTQRLPELAQQHVIERVASRRLAERENADAGGEILDVQPREGVGGAHSRTTRTSPSLTACPSLQRISFTTPSSMASSGISIFIDSRITRTSPSETF